MHILKCSQMQAICVSILAIISEDREEYRDLIIKVNRWPILWWFVFIFVTRLYFPLQDDFKYYKPILKIIQNPETQDHVLLRTLHLLANLATTKHHQVPILV